MIKRVNVRTTTAIRDIQTPIYNSRQNILMSTMDIRTCLMKGAYVDEILNNGTVIRLDLFNYNNDHNSSISSVVDVTSKTEEPVVVSNPKNEEVPVIAQAVEEPAVEAPVAEEPVVENEEIPVITQAVEEPAVETPVAEVSEEVKETAKINNIKNNKKKK